MTPFYIAEVRFTSDELTVVIRDYNNDNFEQIVKMSANDFINFSIGKAR